MGAVEAMALFQFRAKARIPELTPDVIDAFLCSKSENTKKCYVGVFHDWLNFLDEKHITHAQVNEIHVQLYISRQMERKGQTSRNDSSKNKMSKGSIKQKLVILRAMYQYICRITGEKNNPFTLALEKLKKAHYGDKRPTEAMPFNLVNRLLEMPTAYTTDGLRDRAMLLVMIAGALRVSEVLKLKLSDIRTAEDGTIFMLLRETKNGQDANQILPEWAGEKLMQWVKIRLEQRAKPESPLLPFYRGPRREPTDHPISVRTAQRLVGCYTRDLGLKNITPHSLRATVATKLLSDGTPYREVQEVLRHSSIAMVQTYDKRRYSIANSPSKKIQF